jgi:ABC-type branched-subunit amino acid transport system substrate-binding protein
VIDEADTAGDPVDAVPSWRKLAADNPTFFVGPTSHEIQATLPLQASTKIPDFWVGGSIVFDKNPDKYVFRMTTSDTVSTAAMAMYALQKGYTRMSILFASDPDTLAQLNLLTSFYTAHGGTVLDSEALALNATSYRTEVAKAFANHPQAIFVQVDPTVVATLFAAIKELGDLNVPVVGGTSATDPLWVKGIGGAAVAQKWLTAVFPANPTGPAYQHYVALLKAYDNKAPDPISNEVYDAVVIASLAMTEASSTDPTVWINKVRSVSDPSGTVCYTYASCLTVVRSGKKTDYTGASGNDEFNQYGNVFSDMEIVQFGNDSSLQTVLTIAGPQINTFING